VFGIGVPEVLVIALVALLVYGPARLAVAAREWGAALGKIRRSLDDAVADLTSEDHPDEWFEDHGRQEEDLFERSLGD